MELTFAWFWLVKLAFTGTVLAVLYFAIAKYKFKSIFLNILAVALVILTFVSPIKLNPVTADVVSAQNYNIAESKVLPPMKSDDSFAKSTKVKGITPEDLK